MHLQHAGVSLCVCVRVLVFTQGRAGYVAQGSNYARDRATAPLFTYVNENKLKSIETYARKGEFVLFVPFSVVCEPCTSFNEAKVFFLHRFHQLAGQLRGIHGCIGEGNIRGAEGEQALHRCHHGDRCHEGAVAVREHICRQQATPQYYKAAVCTL